MAEAGDRVYGVEVKSGATLAPDFFSTPAAFSARLAEELPHIRPIPRIVYGGERRELRGGIEAVPWAEIQVAGW